MVRRAFTFFIVMLSFSTSQFSQNTPLDSLWKVYDSSLETDTPSLSILNKIADNLKRIDPDSAVIVAEKIIKLGEAKNDYLEIGKAYETMGVISFYKGMYEDAEDLFQISLSNYKKGDFPLKISDAYTKIGQSLRQFPLLDSAIIILDYALEILLLQHDTTRLVGVYFEKGLVLQAMQKYEEAIKITQKASFLDSLTGNISFYLDDQASIADIYLSIRQFDKSLDYAQPVLTKAREIKNNRLCFRASLIIGMVYSSQKNHEMALEYLNEALFFAKKDKMVQAHVLIYGELASVYDLNQNYAKSHEMYDSALVYAAGRDKIAVLNNKGILNKNEGRYKEAIRLYNKIIKLPELSGLTDLKIMVFFNLSLNYKLLGNLDSALIFAIQAHDVAKKNELDLSDEILLHIAEVYHGFKKYDEAFSLQNEAVIYLQEKLKKNSTVQKQLLDFEKAQKENQILQKDLELVQNQKQAQKNKFTIAILSLFLITIGLIATLFYRKNVESKKRKDIIEATKQDIHHRIKNDVQSFSAMISIQISQLQEGTIKNVLTKVKDRILAMGKIHTLLLEKDKEAKIEVGQYLKDLIQTFVPIRTAQFSIKNVAVNIDIKESQDVKLNTSDAIDLGTMINEILTNSFKYAFKNTANPKISISSIYNVNEGLNIRIADNGSGISKENQNQNEDRFGVSMINKLATLHSWQIKCISDKQKGTSYLINISNL